MAELSCFGYIVPVAVLEKWFPDRRGSLPASPWVGLEGRIITAPVATRLIRALVSEHIRLPGHRLSHRGQSFPFLLQNPPRLEAEGWSPTARETSNAAGTNSFLSEALKTWQWWALWLLFVSHTCAGISVISQEARFFRN